MFSLRRLLNEGIPALGGALKPTPARNRTHEASILGQFFTLKGRSELVMGLSLLWPALPQFVVLDRP